MIKLTSVMERYSSYKDSGVQWLGEIPSHWKVVPFKNIANIILGKMLENAPEGQGDKYLCAKDVHMNSINYDDLKLMKFSPEEKKKYAIQKGDMLVVEGGASGSSAIVNKDVKNVYIQNSLMIVRCGENVAYNPFASYMLNSMVNRGYAESVCNKATIMHFTKEKLGATLIAFPPLPEQQAIAEYLDTITSKIDTAIAQQQKMIDLLNERKQIIINNAVTKGLNPNVKMKDSGVDWIGEIPEEWEVKKLKYCVDILPGYAFPSDNFAENGIKLLRGINVSPNKIRWEDTVYWKTEINSSIARYLLKENDLVLGLDRPWINSGTRIAFIHKEQLPCLLLQRVCRIRPIKNTSIRFIYYLLTSDLFYNALVSDTSGVSVPHISTDQVGKITMCFPSIFDQEQIVLFLDKKLSTISDSIKEHESLIALLQERKQIIINEVVTGKVKVC